VPLASPQQFKENPGKVGKSKKLTESNYILEAHIGCPQQNTDLLKKLILILHENLAIICASSFVFGWPKLCKRQYGLCMPDKI
jgi:hypothetical protein